MLRWSLAFYSAIVLDLSLVQAAAILEVRQQQQDGSNITWIDCKQAVPAALVEANFAVPDALPETLKCGSLEVPLDWDKPLASDNKISVGFAIHAASQPPVTAEPKARVLNYNPGGPSLEATTYAWARALGAPESVPFTGLETFDLLAIDVRGTFRSTPLNCTADLRPLPAAIPNTREGYDSFVQLGRHIGETCRNSSTHPELAAHAGSEEVAKDWNAVRQALGVDQLDIWGYSYGTFDAQIYANFFPNATGRVVLDGVYAPGISNFDLTEHQGKALTRVIDRADAYCQSNSSCPLNSAGKGSVQQAFQQILAAEGQNSSSGIEPTDVSAVAYNAYLNTHPQYDNFFLALGGALEGIWDGFQYQNVAGPLSSYVPTVLPVICRDITVEDGSFAGWQKLTAHAFGNATDKYGVHWAQGVYLLGLCAGWPLDVKPNKAYPASSEKSRDILILNSDYDLNTPVEGAIATWKNLPQSTVVIRHGDGHGSLMAEGPARDAAIQFLVFGAVPKANSTAQYTVLEPPASNNYQVPDVYSAPTDGQTNGLGTNGEGIAPAPAGPEDNSDKAGMGVRSAHIESMSVLLISLASLTALAYQ